MGRKILYAHGGSMNHGCEAIVRSITKLLKLDTNHILLSNHPDEDTYYGINNLLTVENSQDKVHTGLLYQICSKLHNDKDLYYYKKLYRRIFNVAQKGDVALSIGGDNYCYSGMMTEMTAMRQSFEKKGIDSILIGCSIDTNRLSSSIIEDLKKYKIIWTRESLTYESLASIGFKNPILMPDPAFALERKDLPLPNGFKEGNTVGINVSPMIIGYEKNEGTTLENYIQLIQYIIDSTDMQVALIPHVIWSHNDDRIPLTILYNKFKETGRVCMIEDHNAEELKGYIARCRFMVVARTHASVAAYSTQVPTLVVGYSIKARGIAKDIFGTEENYVIPVQSLKENTDLTNAFVWVLNHEHDIKLHLESFMPDYIKQLNSLSL